ncbi:MULTISPECIES: Hsp20/alpha crystallin family protein [Thermocrispum]|jgi:HSP20 family protein|uniref:Hsp20/alpha crystallin family protein n=1 Tax=Thermocrispum agreste TaxID=37925 RepID=A0ABD6FGV3_9PSEU|nr:MULTISPECIES: Hsp20/alpha crystallin family protein [Thermocrispum]
MALVLRRGSSWDPFTVLARQFDSEFDQLMRRAFGTDRLPTTGFVPAVDMRRDGTDVVVTAEVPGADNLDVEVVENRLRISGRRGVDETKEDDGLLVREIRTGEFRREFALPKHVTADDVEAEYKDGLLTVRVRNVAKPKPEPRKIPVRGVAEAEQITSGDQAQIEASDSADEPESK